MNPDERNLKAWVWSQPSDTMQSCGYSGYPAKLQIAKTLDSDSPNHTEGNMAKKAKKAKKAKTRRKK